MSDERQSKNINHVQRSAHAGHIFKTQRAENNFILRSLIHVLHLGENLYKKSLMVVFCNFSSCVNTKKAVSIKVAAL